MTKFGTFFYAYIECALWASSDINSESDASLESQNYTIDDFDKKSLKALDKDCASFFKNNFEMIKDDLERAGHDFFLTQNHHGAGFWDGDWSKEIGDKLTKESHNYGETNFWVSEGKIYCE